MKRALALLLLFAGCAFEPPEIETGDAGAIDTISQALVNAGQVAFGDGSGGETSSALLRYSEVSATCGGSPCSRPRLSVGAVAAPQTPLDIQADPVNGLIMGTYASTGHTLYSVNGWTWDGQTVNTPLKPHINLGQYTRGFEFDEAPQESGDHSNQGQNPMLRLLGWQNARSAELLSIRRAPNQTGPLIRAYSVSISQFNQEQGAQTPLFAVSAEGAPEVASTQPAAPPPSSLVAIFGCTSSDGSGRQALCLERSDGAISELALVTP